MHASGPSQQTPEWFQERKIRLTASQWLNILEGKEKVNTVLHGRPTSSLSESCKNYGLTYESAALRSVQTLLRHYRG